MKIGGVVGSGSYNMENQYNAFEVNERKFRMFLCVLLLPFRCVVLLFTNCNIYISVWFGRVDIISRGRERKRIKQLIFAYNISICSVEYIIWCSSLPFSIIYDIAFACIGSVAVIVVFVIAIFSLLSQGIVYSKERLLFRLFLPFASCTYN